MRPVAVPDKIIGLTLFLDFIDRCHSLTSLYLPQAALGSLPRTDSHIMRPPNGLAYNATPNGLAYNATPNGLARLRASHGGCDSPPDCR